MAAIILTTKPARSAALMRITKLEAKKVIMNRKGSLSAYAWIRRWIPKSRKNPPSKVETIWPTHQSKEDMAVTHPPLTYRPTRVSFRSWDDLGTFLRPPLLVSDGSALIESA